MDNSLSGSDAFFEFIFLALDHGFGSIEDASGPLVPFTLTISREGEKALTRFAVERLEDGVEQAKHHIENEKHKLQMYAIAWDGYVTIDGKRWDAILVEGSERDAESAFLFCQRYEKAGLIKKRNVAVGNPALLDKPVSR